MDMTTHRSISTCAAPQIRNLKFYATVGANLCTILLVRLKVGIARNVITFGLFVLTNNQGMRSQTHQWGSEDPTSVLSASLVLRTKSLFFKWRKIKFALEAWPHNCFSASSTWRFISFGDTTANHHLSPPCRHVSLGGSTESHRSCIKAVLDSRLPHCSMPDFYHQYMVELIRHPGWAFFFIVRSFGLRSIPVFHIPFFGLPKIKVTPAAMIDPFEEPALVTPPGLISQFPTTHSNEQKWFFVCVIICAAVSGFFLLLRLYTKLHIVRKLDLTDCLMSHLDFLLWY